MSEILFKNWFVAIVMPDSGAENHRSNFPQNTLVVDSASPGSLLNLEHTGQHKCVFVFVLSEI